MSKISNIILFLDILNTGKKYTVKELSEKLGVSPRMIKYYKSELQNAGIYIETFMGPNGGYFLLQNTISYNQFNKYDLQLLNSAHKFLLKNNYENINQYEELIEKINNSYKLEEEKNKIIFSIEENDKLKPQEKIEILKKGIQYKKRIKIIYQGLDEENLERWIHPLYIFTYQDISYVTAFCELRNDIRHFEINRIKSFDYK